MADDDTQALETEGAENPTTDAVEALSGEVQGDTSTKKTRKRAQLPQEAAAEPESEPATEPEPEPEPESETPVVSGDSGTWSAWPEYPGADQMARVQSATSELNSMVTAALVAYGLGDQLDRSGVDGNWWTGNRAALEMFQRAYQAGETGIVGPDTWALLGRDQAPGGLAKIFNLDLDALVGGSYSDLALLVQSLLILNGYGSKLRNVATREWRADSVLALAAARADYEEK